MVRYFVGKSCRLAKSSFPITERIFIPNIDVRNKTRKNVAIYRELFAVHFLSRCKRQITCPSAKTDKYSRIVRYNNSRQQSRNRFTCHRKNRVTIFAKRYTFRMHDDAPYTLIANMYFLLKAHAAMAKNSQTSKHKNAF